jgi:AraC-like DNA-binding protein
MKKRAISPSVWSLLPLGDNAVCLEDKILLIDHLEMPSAPPPMPMKLPMDCMLIVVEGSARSRADLRDFHVPGASCIVIARNAIVERLEIEAGSRVVMLMAADGILAAPISPDPVTQARLQPPLLEMLLTACRMLRTVLTDATLESGREDMARDCIRLMGRIASQGMSHLDDSATKPTRSDRIVALFMQCVRANYRAHRDLGFYAGELGLSLKHMSLVIHEQTGRHPSQWIKDHVILDAKTMLCSGNYSVQQISDELNFANQSFFGKYFKEAVGVSPKKWVSGFQLNADAADN